ncbi:D-alanyl-D-alanine carboxypeptidase family protein [Clostridium uliginosum]|uniref:D-alanyl-D-alanine carboxypeptidase n=1 Tax=Clostridium uliginosum TaxID=119641 RepID=A0A1I1KBI1_9CLOT|nr:D-alanyl-D-alanine carboxypeptidase [Clostridium uliginosum]SFC57855.1 D-alanyl-D-alanine carboxypeptidase [Clostridium uliginosum]
MKKNLILKTLALTLAISLFNPCSLKSYATENQTQNLPTIQAEAALTMDLETGEVIYCKDGDSKRYPASTTKLLTGLLLAENIGKNDQITFTQSAKDQPEYSLNINYMKNKMQVGDKMLADDVMKGLLLFSGNDTAYMIADNVSGNATAFADLMNKRAKELGANNSNFITANGLHDANHYTTAYDLSLITKAAFQNPWERETMGLKESPINIGTSKIILENRNLNLGKNGNIAGKTGSTNAAGGCLTTVYDRDGRKLIGVVLKSRQIDNADMTKFNDMNAIIDYSYNATKKVYKKANEEVGTTNLEYKAFGFFGPTKTITVPITLTQDVMYYKNDINDKDSAITYSSSNGSAWKLAFNKDTKLTYTIRNHSEEVPGTVGISLGKILKDNILLYGAVIIIAIIIITLIIFIKNIAKNKHKRRRRYKRKY